MDLSPKEQAQAAIIHGDAEVAEFIMQMALERFRGQSAISIALDQRVTQASYLLFTAAAVSATVVAASHSITAIFAAVAAAAYVIGGVVCFRGVRSDLHHAPGMPPAWWVDIIDHPEFKLKNAQCWAAGTMREMLDDICAEDNIRAQFLNLGLKYGVIGSVCIGLAALMRLFQP